MNEIKHIITQWVATTDTERGVKGFLEINTPAVLQKGMFLEDLFYPSSHEAKIVQVTYSREEKSFSVEMEAIQKPMGDEESIKQVFEANGWKVYRAKNFI